MDFAALIDLTINAIMLDVAIAVLAYLFARWTGIRISWRTPAGWLLKRFRKPDRRRLDYLIGLTT